MTTVYHERPQLFLVNTAVAAGADITATGRTVMRGIVTALVTGTGWVDKDGASTTWHYPLTCAGSSDSVAAGMDGVNRWDADSDLVWAAGAAAHSWTVLQSVAGWQILIDLNSATIASCRLHLSPYGQYTGGSTTVRPSAVDEIVVVNNVAWGLSLTNVANQYHLIVGGDGKSIRVHITRNSWSCGMWRVELAASPVTGWVNPVFAGTVSVSTAAPTSTAHGYNVLTTAHFQTTGSGTTSLFWTADASGGSATWEGQLTDVTLNPNAFSGERPLYPIGLVSTTIGNSGSHGRVADTYMGPLQAGGGTIQDGSWYGETSGSYEWVSFGAVIEPWPKTTLPNFGTGTLVYLGKPYLAANSPVQSPVVYQMEAWDNVTEGHFTWRAFSTPDFVGAGYPGPNTASNVAISAVRRLG